MRATKLRRLASSVFFHELDELGMKWNEATYVCLSIWNGLWGTWGPWGDE